MGRISSMFNGITRSFSVTNSNSKRFRDDGREAAESIAKDSKRNDLILTNSGFVNSTNLVSVFSKRGEKGVNQDSCFVWQEFGFQNDMLFCGIFDGHGQWGHYVARYVRKVLPKSLLCNWQEAIVEASTNQDEKLRLFDTWRRSFMKACAAVDHELRDNRKIDSFYSGSTALSAVKQGDNVYIANVGDSRAVLGTSSDDGNLMAVQLTVDFKPNLPYEANRINECKGRVFCLRNEPGVHRVWRPDAETPGLAMSRAFGDYCVKDFGVVSIPEVTRMHVTSRDQFIILATDGVWDVVTNQEAVEIVSAADDRENSAKRLVKSAVKAWRKKRRGIAVDDISAIVLFLHSETK